MSDFDGIDGKYFYYCFKKFFYNRVKSMSAKNSVDSVRLDMIRDMTILIPKNIKEQKAIADVLTNIDNLIESLQKTIEKKEKVYNSLLDELFGNKYKQKENKKIWKKVELVDLCYLITKQTGFDYTAYIKPNLIKIRNDNSLPMIQNKDFKNKEFEYATDYYLPKNIALDFPKLWLKEPCLLVTIVGSIGNIGFKICLLLYEK